MNEMINEAMINSVSNFLPGMDEHTIDEIPGEKKPEAETPAPEHRDSVVTPGSEPEKIGSDDLINNA